MQDAELLRAYVVEQDESAFGTLVRRYVGLVYATALRHLAGNSGLAEEVSQSVFVLLAKKAPSLLAHPSVAGWLYRTTAHLACRSQRSEERRRAREREADLMHRTDSTPSELERIVPMLDEGLKVLNEPDRLALLLRFFLKQPMQEVGRALGVSEAAAKMRVGRAIERLRAHLAARGVSCTSAALALALTHQSLTAAPVHLAGQILSMVSSASLATSPGLWGTLILMSKTKAYLMIGALAFLAVFTAGVRHFTSERVQNPTPGRSLTPTPSAPAEAAPGSVVAPRRFGAPLAPESVAGARLRAALGAPFPKGSIVWPDEDVIRQVQAFPDKRAAFEILKTAAVRPGELLGEGAAGEEREHLVRLRAISSMRYLATQNPEVEPFLWELFKTDHPGTKVDAFSTLKAIGLDQADLDPLVSALTSSGRSPALTRYLPQAIAELLKQHPQAAAPAVARLQGFLDSPDPAARFMSAAALAGTHLDTDPRVGAVLSEALASSDTTQVLSAAEALATTGRAAEAFAPALLQLAQTVPEKHLRAEYLRAVAAIAPEMSTSQPEVAAVMAHDAQARELGKRMETESAAQDELIAALALPQFSTMAAVRLGELGLAASNAAPALVKALEGQDEVAREKIMDALSRVNPNFPLERIDARTVTHAVFEAEISLGDRVHDHSDPAVQFLLDKRKFSTWWTRDEVISVASQLAKLDAKAYAAFADKILQSYPDLRPHLPEATP